MQERVTIGVPVYRGAEFLEETLSSILNQTWRRFEAILSIDGPDPACERIAAMFARHDGRFRVVVQPSRLGWVGNLNWLLSRVETEFWYFHQQDDLVSRDYVESLLAHARENPRAALVFCDLVPFGRIEAPFAQPDSVRGASACARMLVMLREHFPAFAFRGLTRAGAIREAGGIPENEFDNFGSDICWLAGVARAGELLRLPRPLYRKRYHGANTESNWWGWGEEKRLRAWSVHCVAMLEQALRIPASVPERRLLWSAAVERLTSPGAAGYFLRVDGLTAGDRKRLLDGFLAQARQSSGLDIPARLDAGWREIEAWTRGFYWVPGASPYVIEEFGPNPVRAATPFNVQPDGSSSIWARLSRPAEPGLSLKLGGDVLESAREGNLLTARVPAHLTDRAERKPLAVVAPGGKARSRPVLLEILESAGQPSPPAPPERV